MKRALLVGLVLVAGLLTGCGDDDSSTGASKKEFCGTFDDLVDDFQKLGADAEPAEAVKVLKEAGDHLADVGTPSDMPDDARAGFEYVLDQIDKLDDDATRKEIDQLGADATDQQQADQKAYQDYLNATCAALGEPSSGASQGQ
jgi:hypothetical protein